MRTRALTRLLIAATAAVSTASFLLAQSKTYKGLEISVAGVERSARAPLSDCPPGTNNQVGNARGADEFAIVTINVKVLPDFKPFMMARPKATDTSGKVYNTGISFVDVGKEPEYSCAIPFRVPQGTKLKSIQIDSLSLDLP